MEKSYLKSIEYKGYTLDVYYYDSDENNFEITWNDGKFIHGCNSKIVEDLEYAIYRCFNIIDYVTNIPKFQKEYGCNNYKARKSALKLFKIAERSVQFVEVKNKGEKSDND